MPVIECRSRHLTLLCLLVVNAIGCGNVKEPPAASQEPDHFQGLIETSMEELQLKTEAHKAWGLGTFDRWDIDQEEGNLVFSNADGTTAVARAQIIGSFSTNDNSWLWAWGNPSIANDLKLHALKVKEYGEQHGIEKMTMRKWTGSEDDAWVMAALTLKLCEAQGVYRGTSGPSYVFMTFGEVKLSKAGEGE